METGEVNKRLKLAIETGRRRAAERRTKDAEVSGSYRVFLEHVATPVARQIANVLKVEGHLFTLFTPAEGLRLASDKQRDDFVELTLERGATSLEVVGRISHVRGSRTVEETRPIKEGAAPSALTEEDVLTFLLDALAPWLER
jgi:hypothetical protein